MRSVWMSYRLIDEETKRLYLKYHVLTLFPSVFKTLEKVVINKVQNGKHMTEILKDKIGEALKRGESISPKRN
jgi:hypothetical protein